MTAAERWEKLDVWKMAEVKYLVYFAHRLGYLQDAEYTDLKNRYERLGKSLWTSMKQISNNRTSQLSSVLAFKLLGLLAI